LSTSSPSPKQQALLSPSELFSLLEPNSPGFITKDGFVANEVAMGAYMHAHSLEEQGKLQPAGMGGGKQSWNDVKVRGDRTLFLYKPDHGGGASAGPDEELDSKSAVMSLLKVLETLQKTLQEATASHPHFRLVEHTSSQLAFYPGDGAHYARHFDAKRPERPKVERRISIGKAPVDGRCITAIVYLNPSWERKDGGQLRLHLPNKAQQSQSSVYPATSWDVEPVLGKLVLFRSYDVEHEVLPCHAESGRFALTTWFYGVAPPHPTNQSIPASLAALQSTTPSAVESSATKLTATASRASASSACTAEAEGSWSQYLELDADHECRCTNWPGLTAACATGESRAQSMAALQSLPTPKSSPAGTQTGLIFVSIASYRDEELQHTLFSLFSAASHPERLRVGVCCQYHPSEDLHHFERVLPDPCQAQQVRLLHLDWRYARGPCFARYMIQQRLWSGEEYHLQVDSHMRFEKGWDVYLMRELQQCNALTKDSKAILTTYPPDFRCQQTQRRNNKGGHADTARQGGGGGSAGAGDGDGAGDGAVAGDAAGDAATSEFGGYSATVLCAYKFDEQGCLRLKGRELAAAPDLSGPVLPSLFWAAGFTFSRSEQIREVPYDPLPVSIYSIYL
jgi:[Skp1-protein]-hydroxyproline N-acetylglucosaminyltransferase